MTFYKKRMNLVKIENWSNLTTEEKAGLFKHRPEGFIILSEKKTPKGVLEVVFTYNSSDWVGVSRIRVLVPLLDSGYYQIIEVK